MLKKLTTKKRIYKKRKPAKKEFILPLYFGWEIAVRRVNDLRKHIIGPFKKYWQYMTVVILLIALVSSSMLLKNYESVEAATYYFVQSDWSGGLDGGVFPDHTDDKTTWNKYSAVDDNLATSTNLSLTAASTSWTQTTDAEFNLGATSTAVISGTGDAAGVALESISPQELTGSEEGLVGLWHMNNDTGYDDNFDGTEVNSDRWTTSGSVAINSNKLRQSKPEGGSTAAKVTSKFVVSGDFDIYVDFDLITFPTLSGGSVDDYIASCLDIKNVNGSTALNDWTYFGRVNAKNNSSSSGSSNNYRFRPKDDVASTDSSGKFRIKREGTTLSAYYWNGSGWTQHTTSYTGFTADDVNVKLNTWSTAEVTESAVVDYDNFIVSIVTDSSGNSNNGIINGATWTSSGKFDNALDFDGTNDYIEIADDNSLDVGTGDFSIEYWFKRYTSAVTNERLIYKGAISATDVGYTMWGSDTNINFRLCNGTEQFTVATAHSGINNWSHVAVIIDRDGNMSIYMNGEYRNSVDISSFNGNDISNALNLKIGSANNQLYFTGLIDEVAIYNRALTEEEIITRYSFSGNYTSAIYDTTANLGFNTISYSTTTPANTNIVIKVRSCDDENCAGETAIASCVAVNNGDDITTNACVNDGDRYIQYYAELSTTDNSATPSLDSITINYDQYPSSQTLTSSRYNTESAENVLAGVKWDEDTTLPDGTGVTMHVRASSTSELLATTDWAEVASTTAAGFITSGCSKAGQTITCNNTIIPENMSDGTGDQWIQYKIELTSTGANTPTVDDINLVYVVNAPPDFEIAPTASMDSGGFVNISYSVKDEDTDSGVCEKCITPSFQYSLDNGDTGTWLDITAGLSANATSTQIVASSTYTTHNLTWHAKTQSNANNKYSTTAKIKVIAFDSEAANHTAIASTTVFTLDTTAPASASIVVVASTTPANLTLSASDNSGLEMKIAKGATSGACTTALGSASYITYNTSSTLTLSTDPATVCVQYKDGYGNTSSAISATTPETPVNMMIQDTSNMDTTPAEYRLFIAWKIVADPTPGFDRYEIYRSTDNTNYSLIGVEDIMSANYYGDSAVNFDTLYYYKVAVKDGNGNISYLSASVNGKANGTQDAGEGGGGSESTPPVISNVATSSIYTTQATITWDTNELSNSTVGYSATARNFTNEVGVATMVDNADGVGEHSVILTGLTPNTTYYFKVKSIDPSDNIATSTPNANGYMLTTLPGPVISSVTTSETNNTSAVIIWNTDVNSDSTVTYSPNSNLSEPTIITGTPSSVTEHTVNLSGLDQGVKYYYYVKSGVAQDDNGGDYYTFTTSADTTAPTISSVSAANIADTTAVITWTTNEAATSKIEYGTVSGSYTVSPSANANYNYNHTVSVSGLTASTPYYYHVISIDANSNSATSTEYNFTTLEILSEESAVVVREDAAEAEGVASVDTSSSGGGGILIIDKTDKIAPEILDIKILDIRSDSATVSWETNESANSFVEYGLTKNYNKTFGNLSNTTSHSVALNYLSPQTDYNYRVASIDSSGNLARSVDKIFTTLSLVEELEQDTEEELTFEEIEALTEKEKEEREEERKETAESLFEVAAKAVEKAMSIIKQSASQVSIGALESTLTLQQSSIEDLAKSIPAPLMSGEPRVITTAKTAAIAWRTDKDSNSLVAIAPENQYNADAANPYRQVVGNPTAKTVEHAVTIHDLEPDSVYHYQLRNKGAVGPMAQSRDFTFKTEKEILEISNYTIQNVSTEEAIFKWVTNIEANSVIKYIPYRNNILAVDEAKTKNSKAITTIHEIEIDDFEAGVIYEVEMISQDISDNTANEKLSAFSTAEDDMPPIISQTQTASALSPGKNVKVQTIISWKTNEPSTTRVYYQKGVVGADQELSEITKLDTNYTKKHVAVITKFEPGTAYSFKAESIDSGGNVSLSKVHVILTPRQKESVFQVIMKNMEEIFGWVGEMR